MYVDNDSGVFGAMSEQKRCLDCKAKDIFKCSLGYSTKRIAVGYGNDSRRIMQPKGTDCPHPRTLQALEKAREGQLGEYRRG
jgi:hypothetical protein